MRVRPVGIRRPVVNLEIRSGGEAFLFPLLIVENGWICSIRTGGEKNQPYCAGEKPTHLVAPEMAWELNRVPQARGRRAQVDEDNLGVTKKKSKV